MILFFEMVCNEAEVNVQFIQGRDMRFKIIMMLCIVALLTNCAMWDNKRGIFVSSSPQKVKLENNHALKSLIVSKFIFKCDSQAYREINEFEFDGGWAKTDYTYMFDGEDRNILRNSLLKSLEISDFEVKIPLVSENRLIGDQEASIIVTFKHLAMASGKAGSFCCIMAGDIKVLTEGRTVSRPFQIVGSGALSVAGSKNDAIRKFIKSVGHVVGLIT